MLALGKFKGLLMQIRDNMLINTVVRNTFLGTLRQIYRKKAKCLNKPIFLLCKHRTLTIKHIEKESVEYIECFFYFK